MDEMVIKMESCLQTANDLQSALTYVVIVPTAEKVVSGATKTPSAKRFARPSFQKMVSSASCKLHLVLPAREHGYIEGSQHLRPTQYKDSNYDTSVIVLQSVCAQKQQFYKLDFETKIRAAFKSRHKEELESRRKER